jgi:imidazoleglycerol-phosphate dehydratase
MGVRMTQRKAIVTRDTKETAIKVELNIDGKGAFEITTGIRFFDHMLCQLAQHGVFDLKLSATGSDQHHVVEDIGICLGKALNQAMGNRTGLVRMAHAIVPMDDVLAMIALDLGGRGFSVIDISFSHPTISEMPADLIRHFLISFASEAKINIHAKIFVGMNDHHKAEAIFKALARALDNATRIDMRIEGKSPSTKDVIDC